MLSVLLALLTGPALAPAQVATTTEAIAELSALVPRLETLLDERAGAGFSGAVRLERGGQVLLDRAWGLADREAGRANRPGTLFDCGSVSKQFVAAAVLRLQQRGDLHVDQTLARFYPEVPEDIAGVTLHQLLAHTSGLRHPPGLGPCLGFPDGDDPAYLEGLLRCLPRVRPPGRAFEYNNMGYCLLAGVIQRVTGRPYEQAMEELVFAPAGLERTACLGTERLPREDCALAYARDQEPLAAVDLPTGWGHRGATGIVTCTADLARWCRVLRDDGFLDRASRRLLWRPVASGYALGWFSERVGSAFRLVHHSGSTVGFRCELRLYLHADVTLALWTNTDEAVGASTLEEVARRVDEVLRPTPRQPREVLPARPAPSREEQDGDDPAAELARLRQGFHGWAVPEALRDELEGPWQLVDDPGGLVLETDDEGGLVVQPRGTVACDLLHWLGRPGHSSVRSFAEGEAQAGVVLELLAAGDLAALQELLVEPPEVEPGEAPAPRPDPAAWRRTWEQATAGGQALEIRPLTQAWKRGQIVVECQVLDAGEEILRCAVVWAVYDHRLADILFDDWRRPRPGRLSPLPEGGFSMRHRDLQEFPLELRVLRDDEGRPARLRILRQDTLVAEARPAR